jgi:uncharacterized membrane protein YedE/YeeE
MRALVAFIVGFIFAIGLGYSGMTQPHVVKGFLDVFGEWNLSLLGVMGGAIGVHGVIYALIKRRQSPLLDTKFYLPEKKTLDKRLMFGAMIFGIGWGIAGICPGPGLVSIISGQKEILFFVGSMLLGMVTFKFVEKKF